MVGIYLLCVQNNFFIRIVKRQKIQPAFMSLAHEQEYGIFLISNDISSEALTKSIYACPQMSINLVTIKPC